MESGEETRCRGVKYAETRGEPDPETARTGEFNIGITEVTEKRKFEGRF